MTSASPKYRIGFIGVGGMGIANYHAREYQRDPRTEIVACCDIVPEAVEKFSERFGVPARYDDYETMLDAENLDIVAVCTAEPLHARMTIAAAKRRPKAVFCEKPIAMNLREADEMLETCAANSVRLVVGHQRRYNPQYAIALERLRDGAIGDLLQINATGHTGCSLPVDGTHTIDLIRYYMNDEPIEWVMGQVDTRTRRTARGRSLEDAAVAIMKFESGVRAFLTMGGHILPKREPVGDGHPFHYHRIVLHGSTGRIEIEGDSIPETGAILKVVNGDHVEEIHADPHKWHHDLSPQIDLLNVLENGKPHLLDGHSARATLEVLLSVYESARLNRVIALPLENLEDPLEMLLAEEAARSSS